MVLAKKRQQIWPGEVALEPQEVMPKVLRGDFTQEELEQELNLLGLCTLSLGKLKLVADILHVESCVTDHEPFEF
ncbi:hypothetical protein SAMN02746065_10933 [Desulfocicer vacuolatum DSM 3385]|uniref:Uncharacterized protein n=1 Tax=Desulfocicer vacuolatum DSM 3385 TaxID=1121400 RepID=A0A1W2BQI1_9BACT|nr:hypothetical protein [Desulfocicer vacuolatum]SMC74818.1 hypothetical protein SAMN02746065_10933 [Desulfocicer vacuolatum DSM 3385]